MAKQDGLRIGAARRDITPPRPQLVYPSGMQRLMPTQGVLDELYVEALALEVGGELAFLTTSDLRTLERSWVFEIRQAVGARCGCDPRRVLLSSVHNHCSSPELTAQSPPEGRAALDEANRKIVDGFIAACVAAHENCRPAELAYTEAKLKQPVGENRRVRLSNGTCVNCWGSGPVCPPGLKLAGPAGPDSTVVRLLVVREVGQKRPLAVLADYPSHPHLAEVPYFSGEVPGAAKRLVERRLGGRGGRPGPIVLYANNTGGNIDMHCAHPMPHGGALVPWVRWFRSSQKLLGGRLADAIVPAVKACKKFSRPRKLRHCYRIWSSAGEGPELADLKEALTILSGVALGDFAFLSMPGELFIELGLEIRARSPFKKLILLGYNGTGGGYIPKPLGFEQGSYEVMRGPAEAGEGRIEVRPGAFVRRAQRDAGDMLVGQMLRVLQDLAS
jgi:hypothetical protein